MLRNLSILFCILLLLSCKTTTYFVVRHAEKAPATSGNTDVALSAEGAQRAKALGHRLIKEHIHAIYSTSYRRTRSTAQPLADTLGLAIQTYDPRDTTLPGRLLRLNGGGILIVGHSNTVDDLVNQLAGETKVPGDLPDNAYGDLFIIKKKGKHLHFSKEHFGL